MKLITKHTGLKLNVRVYSTSKIGISDFSMFYGSRNDLYQDLAPISQYFLIEMIIINKNRIKYNNNEYFAPITHVTS